jgi:hypothetical protein
LVFFTLDANKINKIKRRENVFITIMRSGPFDNSMCPEIKTLLRTLVADQQGKKDKRKIMSSIIRVEDHS